MRDKVNQLKFVAAIGGVLAADVTSAAIDRQGFDSATIALHIGAGGITFDATNKVEFPVTHSDDGVTYTPVTDADLLLVSGTANGIVKSLIAAKATPDITKIGYVGNKRYLKIAADFSGTHGTGTFIAVSVILSHAYIAPVA